MSVLTTVAESITETLLTAKFQLPKKRPPLPAEDHIVVIGLGRVGRRVATFLQQLKQSVVGVTNQALEPAVLPQLPLVVSEWMGALTKVNLKTAHSLIIVTDDEMVNLEIGLMAHRMNPMIPVVIRTFNPGFSENVTRLLPYAKVLSAYGLSAEAFVAAAFGENILNLIRINEQTVLVTEYQIQPADPLNGMLLSQVAYGYGSVPILHQRPPISARLMPSEDVRLEAGDRLVLLATIDGLKRIEQGIPVTPNWQVWIDQAISSDSVFEGAQTIVRVSNCDLQVARNVMNALPGLLDQPLYQHQAQRLVRELKKVQVVAHISDLRLQNLTKDNERNDD